MPLQDDFPIPTMGTSHLQCRDEAFDCTDSVGQASVGWAKARSAVPTPLFAEVAVRRHGITTPIQRQDTLIDIAVEAAVRPVCGPGDEAMLDGIVVNVIDMPIEIGAVADGVLPITALPEDNVQNVSHFQDLRLLVG